MNHPIKMRPKSISFQNSTKNMNKSLNAFFTIFLLFFTIPGLGQKEYQVKFRINGLKDTACIIANYYGSNTYIKDTVKVDGMGRCIFKGSDKLPKGMYLFVISDKLYFDFIINNDHKFSMETDLSAITDHVVIKNSPENVLFYQYIRYSREQYEQIRQYEDLVKKYGSQSDSSKILKSKIDRVNKDVAAYKLDVIKNNPDSFLTLLFQIMREPEIPQSEMGKNKREDSSFTYYYYKSHFWDNLDLKDDRILRTPIFHKKLTQYFDKVLFPHPDSIIMVVDTLIEKVRSNPEMFKYFIWFSTYHYENSEIMGFDKIFVHLVDKYYATGEVTWLNKTVLENMIKKSNKIKPVLIGKTAPNIIMQDTSLNLVSMQNIKSRYLLLLFWDPECQHCKQEIPKIKEIYQNDKEKYGLEIMAICSDSSLVKMKKTIRDKQMNWINVNGPRTLTGDFHEQYDVIQTPVLYLLNEKKEIIAKKFAVDQLERILINYDQQVSGSK